MPLGSVDDAHAATGLGSWLHLGRSIVGAGMLDQAWRVARRRWRSSAEFVGFRRDLAVPFQALRAKIPLTVRPIAPGEADLLLPLGAGLPHGEWWEQVTRRRLLASGIGACHVGVSGEDGRPCYMIWLIGPADNARMLRYFGGAFPALGPDEALLEGVFTPAPFRGLGIMATATALVAERAADIGARQAVCFVEKDNAGSIKGCLRAGFAPDVVRRDEWRLFRRRSRFEPARADQPLASPPPSATSPTGASRPGTSR